jgi:ribosome-associated toxin RatA of RatAB toxin-antitoxin module
MNRSAVLLALLTIVAAPALAVDSPGLSADQQRRLDAGEVVVLDVLPPGAGQASQGGTVIARVNASPEAVWGVLVDYGRHTGLYPRVVTSQVLESDHAHVLVRYVVRVGMISFGFHVNNYPDVTRGRLTWALAKGRSNGPFRDSWGYWQVAPAHGASGTTVTYAMAARTMLPAFLTNGVERDGLVEAVKAVRERAERRQAAL